MGENLYHPSRWGYIWGLPKKTLNSTTTDMSFMIKTTCCQIYSCLSGGIKTLEFHDHLSLDSDPSYPYSPKPKNTSLNSRNYLPYPSQFRVSLIFTASSKLQSLSLWVIFNFLFFIESYKKFVFFNAKYSSLLLFNAIECPSFFFHFSLGCGMWKERMNLVVSWCCFNAWSDWFLRKERKMKERNKKKWNSCC